MRPLLSPKRLLLFALTSALAAAQFVRPPPPSYGPGPGNATSPMEIPPTADIQNVSYVVRGAISILRGDAAIEGTVEYRVKVPKDYRGGLMNAEFTWSPREPIGELNIQFGRVETDDINDRNDTRLLEVTAYKQGGLVDCRFVRWWNCIRNTHTTRVRFVPFYPGGNYLIRISTIARMQDIQFIPQGYTPAPGVGAPTNVPAIVRGRNYANSNDADDVEALDFTAVYIGGGTMEYRILRRGGPGRFGNKWLKAFLRWGTSYDDATAKILVGRVATNGLADREILEVVYETTADVPGGSDKKDPCHYNGETTDNIYANDECVSTFYDFALKEDTNYLIQMTFSRPTILMWWNFVPQRWTLPARIVADGYDKTSIPFANANLYPATPTECERDDDVSMRLFVEDNPGQYRGEECIVNGKATDEWEYNGFVEEEAIYDFSARVSSNVLDSTFLLEITSVSNGKTWSAEKNVTCLAEEMSFPDFYHDYSMFGAPLPTGVVRIRIKVLKGTVFIRSILVSKRPDSPVVFPGRIQAEYYARSSEGEIECRGTNAGPSEKCYRGDRVDMINVPEGESGVCAINTIFKDEWYEYDITADESAYYALSFRMSTRRNPQERGWHVELDGEDVTGFIEFPFALKEGFEQFVTVPVEKHVYIPSGKHTIRVFFDFGKVDFNWFSFTKVTKRSMLDKKQRGGYNSTRLNAHWE